MTTTPVPTLKGVRDLFEGLLGRDVNTTQGVPIEDKANPAPIYSVFVDDRKQMRVVVVTTLPLMGSLAAGLALLPKGMVEASIEDGVLAGQLMDNWNEVANIMAAIFNGGESPHLRYFVSHFPPERVPNDVRSAAGVLGARLDVNATVSGYLKGAMSVVIL